VARPLVLRAPQGSTVAVGDLKNEFSWSRSRMRALADCPRKYWLHYYGSWGGWERGAKPEVRQAYLLKKVISRQMWIGQEVHERVRICLKMLKFGQTPRLEEQMEHMVQTMRNRFRDSKRGHWVSNPSKILRLFEHEYAREVPDDEWLQMRERAKDCVRGFFESPYFEMARTLPADRWLAVEDLDTFDFEGTKVWVALDFAFRREDGGATVVDWKTGKPGDAAAHRLQMHTYAMHTIAKWGIPAEKIRTAAWELAAQHTSHEEAVDPAALEGSRATIRASIAAMRQPLVGQDPARNEAPMDPFPKTTELRRCHWCQFQRLCWPEGIPDGRAAAAPPEPDED
jgi:CRISPR/Cas system-associated exonuclease Cas4 (RecB family)